MRYTRTALAVTTALLSGLSGTAHATTPTNDDNHGSASYKCTISNSGADNTNVCGNISYGDNATSGHGHNIGTGLGSGLGNPQGSYLLCQQITNNTSSTWQLIPAQNFITNGNLVGDLPASTLAPNAVTSECAVSNVNPDQNTFQINTAYQSGNRTVTAFANHPGTAPNQDANCGGTISVNLGSTQAPWGGPVPTCYAVIES